MYLRVCVVCVRVFKKKEFIINKNKENYLNINIAIKNHSSTRRRLQGAASASVGAGKRVGKNIARSSAL